MHVHRTCTSFRKCVTTKYNIRIETLISYIFTTFTESYKYLKKIVFDADWTWPLDCSHVSSKITWVEVLYDLHVYIGGGVYQIKLYHHTYFAPQKDEWRLQQDGSKTVLAMKFDSTFCTYSQDSKKGSNKLKEVHSLNISKVA